MGQISNSTTMIHCTGNSYRKCLFGALFGKTHNNRILSLLLVKNLLSIKTQNNKQNKKKALLFSLYKVGNPSKAKMSEVLKIKLFPLYKEEISK